MQADDDEMNCPAHAQMHASHSGHGGTKRSGARIQCTGPCHSGDSLIVLNPAPVPERVSNVLSLGDPIPALVHGNFDPSGVDDPPGVPLHAASAFSVRTASVARCLSSALP